MSDSKFPPLDATKIDFPSDQLTLGQIRRIEPELFADNVRLSKQPAAAVTGLGGLLGELQLAEVAYRSELGESIPKGNYLPRQRNLELLDHEYRRFGLSSGFQQTHQMARAIETAARQQAQTHLGKSR